MSDQDLPTYLRGHSLSNADLATTRGAALLKLCQSATADGRLSPDELEGLRQWLAEADAVAMPPERHLRAIIEKVLADGRITPGESKEVHRAIEYILPVAARLEALAARQAVEAEEEAATKAARAAVGQGVLGVPASTIARIAVIVTLLAILASLLWIAR